MAPSAVSVTRPSDEETCELVGQLAEELEMFAFERERVLAKLDIRAAALARRIGRELRVVLRGLALSTSDDGREGVMETLGGLLVEAHRLLEGVPATEVVDDPPQDSGERRIPGFDGDADAELPMMMQRKTVDAMPAVGAAPRPKRAVTAGSSIPVPQLGDDEDADGESQFQDLTIARKVVWERSGNRILGR